MLFVISKPEGSGRIYRQWNNAKVVWGPRDQAQLYRSLSEARRALASLAEPSATVEIDPEAAGDGARNTERG
jgi:hypothetical protein